MALEATHLRFALDLKDLCDVQDLSRFLFGTIYPDSRYLTKVDRTLTHPKDGLDWDLAHLDDFRKGWYLHLLCDKIQREIMKEWIPSAFEGDTTQGGEVWINHTALKIIQEIDDLLRFDISAVLPLLDHVENPNGEDLETLTRYNQLFLRIYANPLQMSFESYRPLLKEFGVEEELAQRVKQQTFAYRQNLETINKIKHIYSTMLSRAKKRFTT